MLKDEMMMIFFFLSISVPWHYRRKNFAQARRSSHVYESIDFNVFKCAQGINLEASKYSPPFSEKKTSPPILVEKKIAMIFCGNFSVRNVQFPQVQLLLFFGCSV